MKTIKWNGKSGYTPKIGLTYPGHKYTVHDDIAKEMIDQKKATEVKPEVKSPKSKGAT